MVKLAYLISAVLFIVGLKQMARPRTAVRGNLIGGIGMLLAVVATLPEVFDSASWGWIFLIFVGLVAGGVAGGQLAVRIQMTAMPQLVALFNGFGGIASVLVAGSDLTFNTSPTADVLVATGLSGIIGAVTFTGSLVAFGKLQELGAFQKPLALPNGQLINAGLAVACLLLLLVLISNGSIVVFWLLVILNFPD